MRSKLETLAPAAAVLTAGLLCLAPATATALDLARRSHGRLELTGHHRLELLSLSSFTLGSAGLTSGSSADSALQNRLRVSAQLAIGRWRAVAAADVPTSAAIRDQADGFSGISPRRLYLSWRSLQR